jgi:hypothetical protein
MTVYMKIPLNPPLEKGEAEAHRHLSSPLYKGGSGGIFIKFLKGNKKTKYY